MSHRLLLVVVGCALSVACSSTTSANNTANVRFYIDAPLCSSVLPVELSIDHSVVAVDTFRVHVANPHDTSKVFVVTAGSHALSARYGTNLFLDKIVVLAPGQMVLDSLQFYCS